MGKPIIAIKVHHYFVRLYFIDVFIEIGHCSLIFLVMHDMDFMVKHLGVIMTVLFLLSELIGENKSISANSIFGLIKSFLKGESLKAKSDVDKLLGGN